MAASLDYMASIPQPQRFLSERDVLDSRREPTIETLSEAVLSRRFLPIIAKLYELSNLPRNWDSYDGQRVRTECANAAFGILAATLGERTPLPWIVPTPDGHVQFEWHIHGIDLEVEVSSLTSIHVLYEDLRSKDPAEEFKLDYDLAKLRSLIDEITSRSSPRTGAAG